MPDELLVSASERAVYETLVRQPRASLVQLDGAGDFSPEELRGIVAALEAKGLISRTAGPEPVFMPVDPALAIEALAHRREAELAQLRSMVEATRAWAVELAPLYRRTASVNGAPPLEVIAEPGAARTLIEQMQRSATEVVEAIENVAPGNHGANELEKDLLEHSSIAYRAIYQQRVLDEPRKLAEVRACVQLGEEARVLPDTPVQLGIIDRRAALLRLTPPGSEAPLYVLAHPSPLLDSLLQLFDLLWERATPLRLTGGTAHADKQLDDIDTRILELLSAGLKDDAIAAHLTLAPRSVRRRIARLTHLLGATSRFQAGLQTARRGWL